MEYLTIRQAAERLQVSTKTISRRIDDGSPLRKAWGKDNQDTRCRFERLHKQKEIGERTNHEQT